MLSSSRRMGIVGRQLLRRGAFLGLAALVPACIDLFHSTDFEAACANDAACIPAASDGSAGDAGDEPAAPADASDAPNEAAPPSDDFCLWDAPTVRTRAARACAWLGACDGPFGGNAFGNCMASAVLAYDCTANPGRRIAGAALDYWTCLAKATSCAAVDACVFPGGIQACGAVFSETVGCSGADGGAATTNPRTRVDCKAAGHPSGAENCVATGQTCNSQMPSTCSGPSAGACSAPGISCNGTALRDCTDAGTDLGIDCALFGKGQCVGDGGVAGCAPATTTACAATATVTCSDRTVVGCPSGYEERIDCARYLVDAGTCDPTAPGRSWDVSRACIPVSATPCTEQCSGTTLSGCMRGVPVTVDCVGLGLRACAMVSLEAKSSPACVAP